MSKEGRCYLCEKNANVSSATNERKDANRVECETCKIYYLDAPIMFRKEYEEMPREKRAMLSSYTRERFEHREKPPELGDPDALKEIIASYENKTLDEKLENLIWYIRKNSPQFGGSVSWDAEKDYPITYSLSPQGFTKMRDLAIKKGLLDWPARGTGLKLTEEGWKLGTELVKRRKKE